MMIIQQQVQCTLKYTKIVRCPAQNFCLLLSFSLTMNSKLIPDTSGLHNFLTCITLSKWKFIYTKLLNINGRSVKVEAERKTF